MQTEAQSKQEAPIGETGVTAPRRALHLRVKEQRVPVDDLPPAYSGYCDRCKTFLQHTSRCLKCKRLDKRSPWAALHQAYHPSEKDGQTKWDDYDDDLWLEAEQALFEYCVGVGSTLTIPKVREWVRKATKGLQERLRKEKSMYA